MGRALVTGPDVEPFLAAEAKTFANITESAHDTLITELIKAARRAAEARTNRAFITQTWELYLDDFPCSDEIEIPLPPLQEVSSVQYIAPGGSSYSTLATTEYEVDTKAQPGRIRLADGKAWPSTKEALNAVKITFIAGYGDAGSNVPSELMIGMKLLVAHYYDNRSLVTHGQVAEIPRSLEILFDHFKVHSFG